MTPVFDIVGIVGGDAMGRGIAQISAQAGSTVRLFNSLPGTTESAAASAAIFGGPAHLDAWRQRSPRWSVVTQTNRPPRNPGRFRAVKLVDADASVTKPR